MTLKFNVAVAKGLALASLFCFFGNSPVSGQQTGTPTISFSDQAPQNSIISAPQFETAPQFASGPAQSAQVYNPVVNSTCNSCSMPPEAMMVAESNDENEPWTLFGRRGERDIQLGGWIQAGYHSEGNGLFNDQPDQFNVHQAWFFAEKAAVSENGQLGFGFRFDGVYGIDAPDTASFGNSGPTFDNSPAFSRNGGFGWALPQIYGEVALGDLSVKVGHFYTLLGYEVVTAPDNFFYSHTITLFNSEPFTHTGALATYNASENLTVFGGWTAGWDSGFDFGAGSNFLGGFSRQLSEDVNFTYQTTIGDFGARSAGNNGYAHSMVLDLQMTENWNTVIQSDLTRVEGTGEDSVGLVLFNFWKLTDRVSFGSRQEWWKGDDIIGYDYGGLSLIAPTSSTSYYASTVGLNYKLNPNITLRPEFRNDWAPALDYEESYFGIDVIATF